MGWNPVKDISRTVSKGFKSITKDPLGALTLGGWSTNALLKGLTGRTANLTQSAIMGGLGFLVGGPAGAGIGAGLSLAQQGTLGKGIQDIATMGASAQQRYLQKMYAAQNAAAAEQTKIAEEQNRQNLLQQIRATRIARAMNLADYAGETGVVSSGALGNLGSIGSQYLSGITSAYNIGTAANAYQTYMNQYNWYQTQAQNSQIRWNNRLNLLNFGLSVYGQGQSLQTAKLGNFYASLRAADAWQKVGEAEQQLGSIPTSWQGTYLGYNTTKGLF